MAGPRRSGRGEADPLGDRLVTARGDVVPTKLVPQRTPDTVLSRRRLLDLVTRGAEGTLTLISAPAGMGKTVLVEDWMRSDRAPGPVAWLSLDAADDDRTAFWRLVFAALARIDAIGELADVALATPAFGIDDVLPSLAETLDARTEPVVLVIDDLHEIASPEIFADVERLLRMPPACLRLIVTTRAAPRLRLQRLRLAGRVTEIGPHDLAFTREEVAAVIDAVGAQLDAEHQALLWEQTEGWPAGLVLASMSMTHRTDPRAFVRSLAGTESSLADYLVEEVVGDLPPTVAAFLAETSIAERLTGDLADAITGGEGGGATLEALYRQGLLLTALDGQREWYRYHRLLRGFFAARLRWEGAGHVRELHGRASRWLADHGFDVDAARHAIHAGDWERLHELVVSRWLFAAMDGELSRLCRLLAQDVPPEQRHHPQLALPLAVRELGTGNVERADTWLRAARAGAADGSETFRLGLATAELYRCRMVGDLEHAQAAIADLRAVGAWSHAGIETGEDETLAAGAWSMATLQLGIVEMWIGDVDEATRDLREVVVRARAARIGFLEHVGLAYLGFVRLFAGDVDGATRHALDARAIAEAHGWRVTSASGVVASVLAHATLLAGRLDEADVHFEEARRLTARSPELPIRAYVRLQLGRLRMAQGNPVEGLQLIRTARELVAGTAFAAPIAGMCATLEVRGLMLTGATAEADALVAAARSGALAESVVLVAQHDLRRGEPARAAAALEAWHTDDEPGRHPSIRLLAMLLRARAQFELGHDAAGRDALEEALAYTARTGLRIPFLEAEGDVAGLLRALPAGRPHAALARELAHALGPAPAARGRRGRRDRLGRGTPAAGLADHLPEPTEPLSRSELNVLRLLPTRLSNREIGEELIVSINTVKTHVKQIYRKLDAHDRRDAVVRARRLGLLAPGVVAGDPR